MNVPPSGVEDVPVTCANDEPFFMQLGMAARARGVPLSGSIALTERCNLRCSHCYLSRKGCPGGGDLATERVFSIVDEIVEAGCLFLLITGGEPTVRKDFAAIYRYAREKGLIVSIFTNGVHIDDNTLSCLVDLPPRSVEVSIYGATKETYEKVSGVKGAYQTCMDTVNRLLRRGVRLRLKTLILTTNQHEFHEIEAIADRLDVPFRIDAGLFPRLDGDTTPVGFRVEPEKVVEFEFSNETRALKWKEFFERASQLPASDHLYTCGAGRTTFHINARGML